MRMITLRRGIEIANDPTLEDNKGQFICQYQSTNGPAFEAIDNDDRGYHVQSFDSYEKAVEWLGAIASCDSARR